MGSTKFFVTFDLRTVNFANFDLFFRFLSFSFYLPLFLFILLSYFFFLNQNLQRMKNQFQASEKLRQTRHFSAANNRGGPLSKRPIGTRSGIYLHTCINLCARNAHVRLPVSARDHECMMRARTYIFSCLPVQACLRRKGDLRRRQAGRTREGCR